jgi:hypothetical protein
MAEKGFCIGPDGTISRLPQLSPSGMRKMNEALDELAVLEAERIISGEPEEPEAPADKYSCLPSKLKIEVEEGGFMITGAIPNSEIVSLIRDGGNIADFFLALLKNTIIIVRRD